MYADRIAIKICFVTFSRQNSDHFLCNLWHSIDAAMFIEYWRHYGQFIQVSATNGYCEWLIGNWYRNQVHLLAHLLFRMHSRTETKTHTSRRNAAIVVATITNCLRSTEHSSIRSCVTAHGRFGHRFVLRTAFGPCIL